MNNNLIGEPLILCDGNYSKDELNKFFGKLPEEREEHDIVRMQLRELFKIDHPGLIYDPSFESERSHFIEQELSKKDSDLFGDWIYFPWSRMLLHTLPEKEVFRLRTNRNKNLITEEEISILSQKTIAVVGLSVGGHFANALAYSAIGGHLKLAEFDTIDTTNLNRLRARLCDVGKPKIAIVAQNIYDINPHAKLSLFSEGLNEENLHLFLGEPTPDIIFEAIDDFRMKILLRLEARKLGIPVVMLTSLGDNILIDIERYDRRKDLPIFHGLIGDTPEKILTETITPEKEKQFAIALVGRAHVPPRAIVSVTEIGKTLVGRPQLASTVFINGGLSAYLARNILLNDPADSYSGRFFISLDQFLETPEI